MRFRTLTAAAAAIAVAVAPVAATGQATVRDRGGAVQLYDGAGAVPSWAAVPAFILSIVVLATAIGAINRARPLPEAPPPPPPTSP